MDKSDPNGHFWGDVIGFFAGAAANVAEQKSEGEGGIDWGAAVKAGINNTAIGDTISVAEDLGHGTTREQTMIHSFAHTDKIAIFLGLYMLSAGIGLITDSKSFAGVMEEFKQSVALTYIAAITAFTIGAVLVTLHNVWATPIEIIVSLVGWVALFEGMLILALRRPFFTIVSAMPINAKFMRIYGFAVLIFAVILLYLAIT